MQTRYCNGLVALITLVAGSCQSPGGSFYSSHKHPDLIINRFTPSDASPAGSPGWSVIPVEVVVRNRGKWPAVKPFRVGVIARNPALTFVPDPKKPAPPPDSYEEFVVGLWSGPPVMQLPGQTNTLVSGIAVDVPINPKQNLILTRQLYFQNPWPGEELELVITADWNHEIPETNESNNVKKVLFRAP